MKKTSLSRHALVALNRSLATSLCGLIFTAAPLLAANRTWDGGDVTSNNWNVGANWNGDTVPVANDALFFAGALRLSSTNNFAANTQFNGITFDSGAGAFVLSGSTITLGGNLVNNSSNVQTINLALRLASGGLQINTAAGDITLAGQLSDANLGYEVEKVGAGTLTLSGTNSNFTGGIKISEGTVRALGHTRNLGAATAPVTLAGGNLQLVHDATSAFSYGNPIIVQTDGTITYDRVTAGTSNTRSIGDITIGASNLTISKGANITNAAINTAGAVTLTNNATFTITGDTITQFGAVGQTGGSNGFTKAGTGLLTLTATNTYTGVTTVSGGTLQIGNTSALLGDIVNNAAVEFNRTTTGGVGSIYGGVISGAGSVTKLGAGRTIFTGNNTNTGTTLISSGTLQLGNMGASGSVGGNIANNSALIFNRSDSYTYGGNISGTGSVDIINGKVTLTGANSNSGAYSLTNNSTLELDFSPAGGVTQNIINNAANNSGLSFIGGHLLVTGAAGEANSQRINGVTTTTGGGKLTALAGTSGGTLGLSLGAITLGSNGSFSIVKNDGATITTTTAADVGTGIYSGRMVINDGSGWNFVTSTAVGGGNYQLQAFTDYGDMVGSGTLTTNGGNARLIGDGVLSGAALVNTLKIETTGDGESLNLGGATLTLNGSGAGGSTAIPGAILFTGSNNYKIENGAIQRNSAIPRTIIVQQFGEGVLEIGARITNGTPSAATSFVKAGFGELILSGSNAYDGTTTIQDGILTARNVTNLGAADSTMTIYGGATFRADATFTLGNETQNKPIALNGLGGKIDVTGTNVLTVTGAVSGANGSLNKTGTGSLALNATNTYAGGTLVSAGTLIVNGAIANTVDVSAGASLIGRGTVGQISGAGRVGPGNSPGILTAASVSQSGGLDYAFEFTLAGNPTWSNAAASGNDILRLTGGTPILSGATGANVFDIYFSSIDGVYVGGLYTDVNSNFESLIAGATFNYYVLDGGGSFQYNGNFYSLIDSSLVTRSTIQIASADFAGGTVTNGWSQQFVVAVPEPSVCMLTGVGLGVALFGRRRRHA